MIHKLRVGKLENILWYLLILALILMSGSIIGWSASYVLYIELLAFVLMLVIKIEHNDLIKVKRKDIYIFGIVLAMFLFNYLVISNLSFWSQKSFFLSICVVFICALYLSYEEYTHIYINIMVIIASVNLFFYILYLFGIQIRPVTLSYNDVSKYLMNFFCIYATQFNNNTWWTPVVRNFGIFWEPGCYQAFLNLALFFFLNNVKINWQKDKKNLFIFLVLVVSIISTLSTTAFFLLIINLIIYYWEDLKHLTRKKFLIIVGVLILFVVLLTSSVVVDKFASGTSSNQSFQIRANDQLSGIKACFYSPIWGMGHNTKLYNSVLSSYGIEGNSSGVLRIIQEFGLIFGLWFIIKQWNTLVIYKKRIGASTVPQILCCVFLFIMFSSEPIIYNPAFMVLLYTLKKEPETVVKKGKYRSYVQVKNID